MEQIALIMNNMLSRLAADTLLYFNYGLSRRGRPGSSLGFGGGGQFDQSENSMCA